MVADTLTDAEQIEPAPLTYTLSKWWGYVFSLMFILYGGVKLVLSFLDRSYTDMSDPMISLAVGLVLAVVAFAYRDRKSWGWYGLVALNVVVAILAVFKLSTIENIVLLVLALLALTALFAPSNKGYLFTQR